MKIRVIVSLLLLSSVVYAADSVDVYFTYKPAGTPSIVYLPGEFNNWASNSGGVITSNPLWNMTKDNASGTWYKTVRLQVGGFPGHVPGAYQYKFNENGCSSCWLNDPLNHHINAGDHNNSFVYVADPTILHLIPNELNPLVPTSTPTISAYIFPKVGSLVDTSALSVSIDGTVYAGIGGSYNFVTQQLNFVSPVLSNGNHTVILTAGPSKDTVTFITQGGFVRFLNQFPFSTWKTTWPLNGEVADTTVTSLFIVRNHVDSVTVPVLNGSFSYDAPLVEGANLFTAIADSAGQPVASSPLTMQRTVNHRPWAVIAIGDPPGNIQLSALTSSDPDSGQTAQLRFVWFADSTNPSPMSCVFPDSSATITCARPAVAGDYFFTLIAIDPDGNRDTTRNYFTLNADSTVTIHTIASNPAWAQKARVYFLFPKAVSIAGTINNAALRLPYIRDLGFNVVWVMPVMKNAYPIDNGIGPGYNIVDFYNVAPEYGTNQDFKNFVAQAHALGLKVILDVTPNHTSRFHPWSEDAHLFKANSYYWNWYEHHMITPDNNGLGDCLDADGFNYYCGFSDQLLNFNWTDTDAQHEMINVYTTWIKQVGLDGYRFDVYWGPHRRYGEQYMGKPVRDALKHIKPDILLLAEDAGTGVGTQTIYADYVNAGINGGVDAAYDFNLYFNQIENFNFTGTAVNSLHAGIDNGGYYPGEHSLYMRFMESQDADRIVYYYSSNFTIDATTTFERTMPMASTLFTAPGFPMIWNGQEVGWGYGITTSQLARTRSVIDFGYQGRSLLAPHYQKLANIRGQFGAFTQHKKDTNHDGAVTSTDSSDFIRITTQNPLVYAFARPYLDHNGLTVVNFSGSSQNVLLDLTAPGLLKFTGGLQSGNTYFMNDLYNNDRQPITGASLDSVAVSLSPYGTSIFSVAAVPESVIIANPITSVPEQHALPYEFALAQNYPNPFNPSTTIRYSVPARGQVTIRIYNLLGQEVATLFDGMQEPGHYTIVWDASRQSSGVYFYRMTAPGFNAVRKMLVIR